ncbi:uncharacterized protein BXZ73DRAFT_79059 [Epithele typhae]|uniref:uncharacterized protein n=1 Tax=Epithele typhae TaxID=378194 RepID=UPI0020082DF8|nr:uncharacterized protein BXZ73DRAFT_79059 [Epithele typhae]KAH9925400.1 hypothetical protein BXZ73DRAFT_79059 [Epithele typhae]
MWQLRASTAGDFSFSILCPSLLTTKLNTASISSQTSPVALNKVSQSPGSYTGFAVIGWPVRACRWPRTADVRSSSSIGCKRVAADNGGARLESNWLDSAADLSRIRRSWPTRLTVSMALTSDDEKKGRGPGRARSERQVRWRVNETALRDALQGALRAAEDGGPEQYSCVPGGEHEGCGGCGETSQASQLLKKPVDLPDPRESMNAVGATWFAAEFGA